VGREIRSVYRGEPGFKIADAVRAEINEQDCGMATRKTGWSRDRYMGVQRIGERRKWRGHLIIERAAMDNLTLYVAMATGLCTNTSSKP